MLEVPDDSGIRPLARRFYLQADQRTHAEPELAFRLLCGTADASQYPGIPAGLKDAMVKLSHLHHFSVEFYQHDIAGMPCLMEVISRA